MRSVLLILALGLTSGCGVDTFVAGFNAGGVRLKICKGDDEFCQDVLNPPKADAGVDRTVAAASRVTLDGSASNDPDGNITSFAWQQIDGPLVSLTDPNSWTPSFDAPAVGQTTPLRFTLTVTDNDDETGTDQVEITVQPRTTLAAIRGLEWLQNSPSPATNGLPKDVGAPGVDAHATMGTWLVATTTGRHLGHDPTDVESHLANLRGLITSLEQQSAEKQVTTEASVQPCATWGGTAVLVAGLAQTATLLDGLDASLAERYRDRADEFEVTADWDEMNTLYQGEITIQQLCEGALLTSSRDAIAQAASILLDLPADSDADTLRVAAATLTVLGALSHDDPQMPSVPTSTQIPLSQRSTATPLLTNTPSS